MLRCEWSLAVKSVPKYFTCLSALQQYCSTRAVDLLHLIKRCILSTAPTILTQNDIPASGKISR